MNAPKEAVLLKLVSHSWEEQGGLTATLTDDGVNSSCVLHKQTFSAHILAKARATTITRYLELGYSYRNVNADQCQLWRQIDGEDNYHFVLLTVEREETVKETKTPVVTPLRTSFTKKLQGIRTVPREGKQA